MHDGRDTKRRIVDRNGHEKGEDCTLDVTCISDIEVSATSFRGFDGSQ